MQTEHDCFNDEKRTEISGNIERFRCHLVMIEPDNYLPGFVYSIGLFQNYNHPEIICFGLKIDVMARIINDACAMIAEGNSIMPNHSYADFLMGVDVQFLNVDKAYYPDYFGYGSWYYGKDVDFPAMQLVWPDKQNKFPWEPEFNSDWKFKQPLLDRNVDFKFYEERNLGVYTTKQAFEGHHILYVYHNIDGDWQFHTSDNPSLDDAKLVCLEHLVKIDPSLNNIFHLQYGWNAWRTSPNDEWQYEQGTEEEDN